MRITEGLTGCVTLSYILKNGQDFNTGSAGGSNSRSQGAGSGKPSMCSGWREYEIQLEWRSSMVGRLTDELERRLRHGLDPWVKIPGSYPQRRKWQPIPVFLPGESHGQRSLAGYSPWVCKESGRIYKLSTHPKTQFWKYMHKYKQLLFIF